MDPLPFVKMHGLGNDFVVFDGRERAIAFDDATARAIADRRTGVGCDQVIVIEPSRRADAAIRIHNADGGIVDACGNATRCVASLLMAENGGDRAIIESAAGIHPCETASPGSITVDMGPPRFDWQEIPLAEEADTLALDFGAAAPGPGCAVNMGNPHLVFIVADTAARDIERIGKTLEIHPLFPDRVNVEIAEILDGDRIRARVWERGVGVTRACGTGACATLVAAHRRGLSGRQAEVMLDGGSLRIVWREDNHVWMTGPVATSLHGVLASGAVT